MRDVYQEYKKEHPEELTELGRIYQYSAYVEDWRRRRREAKVKKIKQYREMYENGENRGGI